MDAEQVAEMRRVRPADFNRHVAEHVHGEKPPEGAGQHEGEWGTFRDGPGSAWWFESRWPRRYTTDPAADYATFRHVEDTWEKRDKTAFHIACREMWESRDYLGSDPWQKYVVGDYSAAALSVRAGDDDTRGASGDTEAAERRDHPRGSGRGRQPESC